VTFEKGGGKVTNKDSVRSLRNFNLDVKKEGSCSFAASLLQTQTRKLPQIQRLHIQQATKIATLQYSTMSSFLSSQAIVNNEAVCGLVNGDASGAIKGFQHAIAIVKSTAEQRDCWPNKQQESSAGPAFHPSEHALQGLQDGKLFVFDRPLFLSHGGDDSEETLELTSAILMFNFALATHQLGKLTSNSRMLLQSKHLYDLTLRCCSNKYGEAALVLQCLALNNLAHILHEECDYSSSKLYMHRLATITDDECLLLLTFYVAPQEVEEILLNLLQKEPAAAQAA